MREVNQFNEVLGCEVEIGDEVKDEISGFKGTVIGMSVFLYGCVRVGVQAKADKSGGLHEVKWFDEPQLKVTKKRKIEKKSAKAGKTKKPLLGGPMPSIPTRSVPK